MAVRQEHPRCHVKGCSRPARSKAQRLCTAHHRRLLRHGDVRARVPIRVRTGRHETSSGYIVVSAPPNDPLARAMKWRNGQLYEHRLVLAHKIGRPLLPSETAHHRDGNRSNNAPSNLELRVGAHGPGARVADVANDARRMLAAELRRRRDRRILRQLRRLPARWQLDLGDLDRNMIDFTSTDLSAALRRLRVDVAA